MQEIPYIAYEAECARHDRAVKRLVAVIVLCVLLIVGCNIAWLIAWNQYDYEVTDESIDLTTRGGGNASYIGNDGDINNYGNDTSETGQANP
jgi:hypothetical protein